MARAAYGFGDITSLYERESFLEVADPCLRPEEGAGFHSP